MENIRAVSLQTSSPAASSKGEKKESGIQRAEYKQKAQLIKNGSQIMPEDKVKIGSLGHLSEKAADVVADKSMHMPEQSMKPTQFLSRFHTQRNYAECEEGELSNGSLMRNAEGSPDLEASPAFISTLNSTRGGGSPLPEATKNLMEKAFNTDFSKIRIHSDSKASEMSKAISAEAFTAGSDLYFQTRQYNPNTFAGLRLLAHELTHAIQQKGRTERIQCKEDTSETSVGSKVMKSWENPYLRKIIYPYREEALREFLRIYRELELANESDEQLQERVQKAVDELQQEINYINSVIEMLKNLVGNENIKKEYIKSYEERKKPLEESKKRLLSNVKFEKAREIVKRERAEWDKVPNDALIDKVKAQAKRSGLPDWQIDIILDYSGMRYESAHGSWYSLQKLLSVLLEPDKAPEQIKENIREIKDDIVGLINTTQNIMKINDSTAITVLKTLQVKGYFPKWVWREIVRRTELRLEEVESEDWDQTPEEKNLLWKDTTGWRDIIQKWQANDFKKEGYSGGVTGWRNKMYKTNALVVIRTVCNEVAEATQSARGFAPDGGLAGQATWYNKGLPIRESFPFPKMRETGAYFRRLIDPADVKPGAAIFYTGWTMSTPDESKVVVPMAGIDFLTPKGGIIKEGLYDWPWTYHVNKNEIYREKNIATGGSISEGSEAYIPVKEKLQWTHVATVFTVSDTDVILFETSNPEGIVGAGRATVTRRNLKILTNGKNYIGFMPNGKQ